MKGQFKFLILLTILLFGCSSDDGAPSNADISVDLLADSDPPIIGSELTFTVILSNSGPATANGLQVEFKVPSGYTYVSDITDTGSYNVSTGIWMVSALEKDSSTELTVKTITNDSGDHSLTAELVDSETSDPDSSPGNDEPSEDDQATLLLSAREPSKVIIETYASISAGDGLSVDEEGNVYVTNFIDDKVYKIDLNKEITTFASNQDGAAGMVFDDSGNMFVARYSSSEIGQISPDGSSISTFATGVAAPIAVDFDSNGNLYANNNVNNAITRIDADGNKTIISTSIFNNSSLTIDDQDNIYVSDYTTGRIMKIDPSTNIETTFANLRNSGLGFIIYSNDFFYATGIDDHVIYMIDRNGNSEIIAGKTGISGNEDGNGDVATFTKPNAIGATADGRTLYVSGGGKVRVITGFRED